MIRWGISITPNWKREILCLGTSCIGCRFTIGLADCYLVPEGLSAEVEAGLPYR